MAETSFDDVLLAIGAIREIQDVQVQIASEVAEIRRQVRELRQDLDNRAGSSDGFAVEGLDALNSRCDGFDERLAMLEHSTKPLTQPVIMQPTPRSVLQGGAASNKASGGSRKDAERASVNGDAREE